MFPILHAVAAEIFAPSTVALSTIRYVYMSSRIRFFLRFRFWFSLLFCCFFSTGGDGSAGTLSPLPVPASVYPTMTFAATAPLSDADFNRSILARGLRLSDLACLPISSGWFRREIEDRRRLIKVQCYSRESTANFYMRPIEGLTVLVLDKEGAKFRLLFLFLNFF
ncbi:Primary amine oxidase [Apostasia shenzhenica]|uniref:Amine oxidase n=1 Tax=Apostasia shenzhenica TaxID=1088818 RepID=A0A2I0AQ76_9ASPA|nr:Primary amine oxidase [Apostasia shenzhenica]